MSERLCAVVAGVFLGVSLAGCSSLSSSSIRTGTTESPYTGQVRLAGTWVPPGARELGVVQATGANVQVDEIIPEFARRVGELGGDFGKIDRLRTSFELRTIPVTTTYNCGTVQAPRTCTRTSMQTVEVAVTAIEGRAYTTRDPVRPVAPGWGPPPSSGAPTWPPPAGGAASTWGPSPGGGAPAWPPPANGAAPARPAPQDAPQRGMESP